MHSPVTTTPLSPHMSLRKKKISSYTSRQGSQGAGIRLLLKAKTGAVRVSVEGIKKYFTSGRVEQHLENEGVALSARTVEELILRK